MITELFSVKLGYSTIIRLNGLIYIEKYGLPNTVQYGSVRENSDIDIRHNNVMRVAFLLVGEEKIRHPYPVCFCKC